MAKKSVEARIKTEIISQKKASGINSAKSARTKKPNGATVGQSPKKNRTQKEKPKKEPRRPHQTRPTPAEEPLILERQNLVMDLKTNGVSFRRIEKRLKELGHDVCLGTVYNDYAASLERLQTMNVTKTELLVTQELEKIEDWEFDLNALKSRKNLSVYEIVAIKGMLVSLQNQRDKFLAISKPKVIKIQSDLDFAKALGVSPENLPDDDESDD